MKSKLRYIFSVIMLLVSVAVFSNGSAEAANQVKEFYQENYTDDNYNDSYNGRNKKVVLVVIPLILFR